MGIDVDKVVAWREAAAAYFRMAAVVFSVDAETATGRRAHAEPGEVPEGEHIVPLGQAAVRREGGDVTIVALGWMLGKALAAAEQLAAEGIEAEVIDPRTLAPLDLPAILASVEKTGRLVIGDQST